MGHVWLTVDVEAQPARAAADHVERLIWGRHGGPEEFGIGRMMDVADYFGVPLTLFTDLPELDLHGPAFREVPETIVARGHDLQLHAHTDFFAPEVWTRGGVDRIINLNHPTPEQAAVIAGELVRRHREVAGTDPLAFRGGGYRYSEALLSALFAHGVVLDSSVNRSRDTQPMRLPDLPHFLWDWGTVEVPVAAIEGYPGRSGLLDFNFNTGHFRTPEDPLRYLELFFAHHGDDAAAVMVMHSWSLLDIASRPHFGAGRPDQVDKLVGFLRGAVERYEFVDSAGVLGLVERGGIELRHVARAASPAGDAMPVAEVGEAPAEALRGHVAATLTARPAGTPRAAAPRGGPS
jgi:hypothetical protein